MTGFDWPALLRVGVRGMRLRPAEFWALTPAEFRLMMGIDASTAPMGRASLEALSQAYPDTKDDGDGRD